MSVFRCFTEKREGFDGAARALLNDLRDFLGISGLKSVRILCRYDVEGISAGVYQAARDTVFSEPQIDIIYDEIPPHSDIDHRTLIVEALPGQYDQRADSCALCIQLLTRGERPEVRTAFMYVLEGDVPDDDMDKIRGYLINRVEAREASSEKPETLATDYPEPEPVGTIDGFVTACENTLRGYLEDFSLAMDLSDLRFMQSYFRDVEQRDPTVTELRVIDTYWSDHCRHTTFNTQITEMAIDDPDVRSAYDSYLDARREAYGDAAEHRPVTLMDIATIAAKALRSRGLLKNIDISEEVNACSIHVGADADGKPEDWLLMFKNETHNHPTEVEPFGGAATCIGGAIRDPLSGRAYVYQAMRVTGAGDPRAAIGDTLPGKLPQRKLTVTAAQGYSSYGNQIGLATGLVHEIYHPGYVAKRMELGAVVGAVKAENVVRCEPAPGDKVILLGGRTGRDGIGGATGSSKSHTAESLVTMASEVQKGNAPEERKIQRLFLDPEVTKMIKRCNDFGAGGVSVAVGELADGIDIDLSLVRKKYEGLDGTEIAISESQERMAVVVAPGDADGFIKKAAGENLEAYVIAEVAEAPRMIMRHNGTIIVDLSREFLSTNGAVKYAKIHVPRRQEPGINDPEATASGEGMAYDSCQPSTGACPPPACSAQLSARLQALVSDLRFCSQRGLHEMFDGSVGASSVLMKNGGKTQSTPTQVMASLLPVGFHITCPPPEPGGEDNGWDRTCEDNGWDRACEDNGKDCAGDAKAMASAQLPPQSAHGEAPSTMTCSVMSFGFDPRLSSENPFLGAKTAVITSVAKLVAAGCDPDRAYLTFQEYFERLRDDPARWGKPFSALLGAFEAQMGLELAAIGGKDSMSGSYNEFDVPPTLVSFAVAPCDARDVISPEFKEAGHDVVIFNASNDPAATKAMWKTVHSLIADKTIVSAWALTEGGAADGVLKMTLGNEIGFELCGTLDPELFFARKPGAIVAEAVKPIPDTITLGRTIPEPLIKLGAEILHIKELKATWENTLEGVFPTKTKSAGGVPAISYNKRCREAETNSAHVVRSAEREITGEAAREPKSPSHLKGIADTPGQTKALVAGNNFAKPRALILAFPGTNSEIDTARAVSRAGGTPKVLLARNLTASMLEESISETIREINESQIIIIPGGFSFGDEPDGSAKFITVFFRNPGISDAVHKHLHSRDGLMLGICNGFQALIKLGLVPFGEIVPPDIGNPTLAQNIIGRHQARYVYTRVASVNSPWMSLSSVGDIHAIAISHGEGRFIASPEMLGRFASDGRIATQYTDIHGNPSMDADVNPNGSMMAVEGLFSPDGRVFGKMGHTERRGGSVAKNIYGDKHQPVFESGVNYFK